MPIRGRDLRSTSQVPVARSRQGRAATVAAMDVIVCQCGRVVHGETEAAVVAAMRAHLGAEHPQLAGATQEVDLRAMVEPQGEAEPV